MTTNEEALAWHLTGGSLHPVWYNNYLRKVVLGWVGVNYDDLLNEAARRDFAFTNSPAEAVGDFVLHMLDDIFSVYVEESDYDIAEQHGTLCTFTWNSEGNTFTCDMPKSEHKTPPEPIDNGRLADGGIVSIITPAHEYKAPKETSNAE